MIKNILIVFMTFGFTLSQAYNLLYHGSGGAPGGLTHILDAEIYGNYIYTADVRRVAVFEITGTAQSQAVGITLNGGTGYNVGVNDKIVIHSVLRI